MPFQDLPHRREDTAPILDLSDPCEIWRYFDDLEFLFLKHRVSDDQEKKRAAVNYPSVAVEQLWKTARAFGEPARSYEDFKAEVITLYPEAIAAQEHSIADLDRLVAHQARTPISSETELGAYYREFLLVSRFLIAKGRISVQAQARHLLASFEPRLATAVCARLERKFTDHFPDDPYDTEAIYDAALYALAWQRAAPLVDPPRDISTLSTSSLTSRAPHTSPPSAVHAFPFALQHLSSTLPDSAIATCVLTQECTASLVPVSRDAPQLFTTSPAKSSHFPTPPPPSQAFPPALRFTQADMSALASSFVLQHRAPLVSAPRDVPSPSTPTSATPAPVPSPPMPAHIFPLAPEPIQPAQPDSTAATLDALADVIAALKSGLEAILNTQKSAESRAPEPEATQSQAERCRFCGSAAHLEEECEEADEYILTGMCKRNVFGRLTLPSGAEVSRRIKGKCLRERFEEYHRQFPGQRAAPAYLEDPARPRRPAPQDTTTATPSAMRATSPGAEAIALAMSEESRRPRFPKRTLGDQRAASDQMRAPEASGDLLKPTVRFSDTLGVPETTARPVPGQSEPERDEAATSSARSQTRESNFAAIAASDREEAPLMVSQRGLFAFIPGIRSEAARAAASTPARPTECAAYLVQEATPQLTPDRVSVKAKRPESVPSSSRAIPSSMCAPPVEDIVSNPQGVPPHTSSGVIASPSIHVNIPKRPQAAPRASLTPRATRSRPQWPRSRLSHHASACEHQRFQHRPLASFHSLSPRPMHSVSPHAELRHVKPSDRQPATRHRPMAPRLPFYAHKPPNAMRPASAIPVRSIGSDTPAEVDWGQSIFHVHFRPFPTNGDTSTQSDPCPPIAPPFTTFADAHDSDATSARTPATYAKTLSKYSASDKRSQPAQRHPRVLQLTTDDLARSQWRLQVPQQHAWKSTTWLFQGRFPTASVPATAPASRAPSHLAQGFSTSPSICSSVSKSRKQVHGKSDIVLPEEHPLEKYLERRHTSNHAAIAQPSATQQSVKDYPAYQHTRFRLPQQRAQRMRLGRSHRHHKRTRRPDYRLSHAPDANPQQRAQQPRLDAEVVILEQTAPRSTSRQPPNHNAADRCPWLEARPSTPSSRKRDVEDHRATKSHPAQQPARTALNLATASLAPRTRKTPAIGTRTASERSRRMRMTEDSQDLISTYFPDSLALTRCCALSKRRVPALRRFPALYAHSVSHLSRTLPFAF
ncbi:hypothetical protein EDB83DRAFT_2531287 [Lactarius deliciosus]|nr:hypothetical protein EDB83DRAFT_2531287 [Lactarius deliciosus]